MSFSLRIRRILVWIILTASVIVFAGAMIFLALQMSGKMRLERQTKGIVPRLFGSDPMEASTLADNWQEGDVLYQGVHYRYNDDILTFLFLGIDRMEEVKAAEVGNDGGQADAIFLLVLNPHAKEISIIGIDRNTMTDVDVYDRSGAFVATQTLPLCLQHDYGDGLQLSCERSEAAVSNLFCGIPISGYCAVNMGAIPLINDAVGGVKITALEDVPDSDIREGDEVLLEGQSAYYYLHNRDGKVPESARMRLERQIQYVTAYSETTLASLKENPTLPIGLYQILGKYMVTDVSLDEVSYLATQAADYKFDAERIYLPEGKTVPVDILQSAYLDEGFYPDETAFYELMLKVFYEEVED